MAAPSSRHALSKEQPLLLRGQAPHARYLPIAPTWHARRQQGPPPQELGQASLSFLISNTSFSQEGRIQRCNCSLSTLIRSRCLLLPALPEAETGAGMSVSLTLERRAVGRSWGNAHLRRDWRGQGKGSWTNLGAGRRTYGGLVRAGDHKGVTDLPACLPKTLQALPARASNVGMKLNLFQWSTSAH